MHQSVIEIGTGICKNIAGGPRRTSARCAPRSSASPRRTACASRRPARTPSPTGPTRRSSRIPRYDKVVEEMQLLARANLIFGLHVHVGIKDRVARVPDHERGAVLPAAPAGALDQLAVLAGPQHGAEELSARRSSTASRARACRSTSRRRPSSTSSSASSSRPTRSTTARRSGGTSARTRSSRRSSSASATCRCGSTRRSRSPRSSRRSASSSTSCACRTWASAATAAP